MSLNPRVGRYIVFRADPVHIDVHLGMSLSCVQDISRATVLPAKSDSDVMFCLQSYQGLIIDISLFIIRINTQVIYRFELAQDECTN